MAQDTAYYIVVYGYDEKTRKNTTMDAVLTLSGETIQTIEGVQAIKNMVAEELKLTNVCIMNQIPLDKVPAAGVFKI